MKLFLSPHNDDETLFGGFLIRRFQPEFVVIVYDSYIQCMRGAGYCDAETRRAESVRALEILTPQSTVLFAHLADDQKYSADDVAIAIHHALWTWNKNRANTLELAAGRPYSDPPAVPDAFDLIISPLFEDNGHEQHNVVALAADKVPAKKRLAYTTYTRGAGRTTNGEKFDPTPDEIACKLRAKACYLSQIRHTSTRSWFADESLAEYTREHSL